MFVRVVSNLVGILRVTYSGPATIASICSRLQTDILNTMLGPEEARPSHVATFGNLVDNETAEIGDWVALNSVPPQYDQVSE